MIRGDNPITVEATDAKANATITAILNEVQAFTELPTIAPVGYQVEIAGDPGTSFDNYYVEFEPRSGNFGEGSWVETASPGVEYKIEPDTMPHVLIRKTNGEFWFGPVNGQTSMAFQAMFRNGASVCLVITRQFLIHHLLAMRLTTSLSTRTVRILG